MHQLSSKGSVVSATTTITTTTATCQHGLLSSPEAAYTTMLAVDEPDDRVQPAPQSPPPPQGILALPTELIHTILLDLPPLCIEHFSQTCKLARRHVYGDRNTGDLHLWKRLYLERFDDFPSLWQAQDPEHDEAHEESPAKPAAAASSIMSLVQTRDRAARLFAGDPSNHTSITLNFNAVLSALLSVVDTAVPAANLQPCRNSTWLDNSVLASGQPTWSQWIFPRSIMHSLGEHKAQALAHSSTNAPSSPQALKRRRLSNQQATTPSDSQRKPKDSTDASATPTQATPSTSSARRASSSSSKSATNARPESSRRRSARLLKLIYPEPLHPLVDQGIDIDALAHPLTRLAARIHCLHGIRAWKDSQSQRLTASPQEIAGQRSQDGLANQGAAQASAQSTSSAAGQPETEHAPATPQPASVHASDEAESDDDDQESFDEPPAAILGFRPRMFGPSFGFCNAPDEEDQVRARMRHRVYDSAHYGWSNGFAPLHAWRYNTRQGQQQEEDDRDHDAVTESDLATDPEQQSDEEHVNEYGMRFINRRGGSDDGDDDAWREAFELDDASDDIPDDPIPIEIEMSEDEQDTRTFRVADRYGNPIPSDTAAATPNASAARGWGDSDDEEPAATRDDNGESSAAPAPAPYQTPELGSYDADTRTYTYEGHQPIGIVTGSQNIQVTVGDSVDFVASGELNVRFVRPGMLAETMRVTSGHAARRTVTNGIDGDEDEDMDDDYDEDAEEWDEDVDEDDEDDEEEDGRFGPFFDMFRPLDGAWDYRGSYAADELQPLVAKWKAEHQAEGEKPADKDGDANDGDAAASQIVSLRRKSIHWELVEAIMVVMYANLKEAIWLENWGVGIRIPKVYDHAGVLVRDPMERREFLEFPTGWVSSLAAAVAQKRDAEDAVEEGSRGVKAEGPAQGQATSNADDDKPHDWARCESFWAGTYAFLDYSHFVEFNVRMARRRRDQLAAASNAAGTDGKASSPSNAAGAPNGSNGQRAASTRVPNLVGQEEAVGDCLQLRLELLPKSEQPAYRLDEEGQEDDLEYPTLYFRGTTVTYWGNDAPMPRGGVHGKVRPVYARDEDADATVTRGKRKIEGLHWSLTHVYDGEDRWQLEGIQPGPPGTRAPMFGVWSDAAHEAESPNGPFVYWMMDERPWKEIERLNRKEAQMAAAARTARTL